MRANVSPEGRNPPRAALLPQANELSSGSNRISFCPKPPYCRSKSQERKDLRQLDKTVQLPGSSALLRRKIRCFGHLRRQNGLPGSQCPRSILRARKSGQRNFWLSLALGLRYNLRGHSPRRGGREAEGGGLLNRCRGQNLYRGFESPPLRQISPNCF